MNLLVAILFVFGFLFILSIVIDKVKAIWPKRHKVEGIQMLELHEPRAIVVAGSYFQFHQWCMENNLNRDEYIYATEHSVHGHHLPIIRVGTWWEQSEELLRHLRTREIESAR